MDKNTPTGVKVISVLMYIIAALLLLLSLLFFVGSQAAERALQEQYPTFATLGAAIFVLLGILLLVVGILYIFIGKGLWKGKNWAKIVAIILSALGLLQAILSIRTTVSSGILMLAINGVIIYYLGFSKEAKKFFS